MTSTEELREKLDKILSDYFPDDMDSSMYHPNHPPAVDKLISLFQEYSDARVKEDLEGIKRFILNQGSKLEPFSMESLVRKHQISSDTIESIWYEGQKRLVITMARGLDDIIESLTY